MANDVAINCLPGQPVKLGYVVTSVLPTGKFQTLSPGEVVENQVSDVQLDAIFGGKLDYPTYYTA